MFKLKQDCSIGPAPYSIQKECMLWTNHWVKCAKELNQWDLLLEIGQARGERNPFLILESSWRNPNWTQMKEALKEIEYSCPKEMGIIFICFVYVYIYYVITYFAIFFPSKDGK